MVRTGLVCTLPLGSPALSKGALAKQPANSLEGPSLMHESTLAGWHASAPTMTTPRNSKRASEEEG